MIDYILNYLADKDVCASSQEEQEALEAGISAYLLESGIDSNDTGDYYRAFVKAHLDRIADGDLKAYFLHYPLISGIRQIVIEFEYDKHISEDRKRELYRLMEQLHKCGLGEAYIPVAEVKQILGVHA